MQQNNFWDNHVLQTAENNLVRASMGKRMANYIIDYAAYFILAVMILMVILIVDPVYFEALLVKMAAMDFGHKLYQIFFYALFMSLIEALCKGKSLGKLITGTRAVNEDGSPISVQSAFSRGLCRAIPFCVFSAFGDPCNPWQDRWTNTMVIDEKASGRA